MKFMFIKSLKDKQKKCQHITVFNEAYHYDPQFPLVSIHLGSNRRDKLTEFVDALESVTSNKNAYEVNVKIDSEDTNMIECVQGLIEKYGSNKIKPLIAPRKNGLWSLWEYYNQLFYQAHPKAYFFWNPSDEVRIMTPGWDQILEKYIGFFHDHVFRLKLSDNRLRNFYHFREILGTPDNFPFITKKWMDICGTWNDCHSPDVVHQGISYFLGKMDVFRDIPIFDIKLSGTEASCLLTPKQLKERHKGCRRVWRIATSRRICKRYYAHASKLLFYMLSCEQGARKIDFYDYIDAGRLLCKNNVSEDQWFKYVGLYLVLKQNIPFKQKLRNEVTRKIQRGSVLLNEKLIAFCAKFRNLFFKKM